MIAILEENVNRHRFIVKCSFKVKREIQKERIDVKDNDSICI